jgi:hypothetical protein
MVDVGKLSADETKALLAEVLAHLAVRDVAEQITQFYSNADIAEIVARLDGRRLPRYPVLNGDGRRVQVAIPTD